jgi:hypothetical protein
MNNKELSLLEEKLKYDDLSHDDCVLLIKEIKTLKSKIHYYESHLESEQEGKYSQGIWMFSPSSKEKIISVPASIGANIEKIKINTEYMELNRDYTISRSERSDQIIIDFSNYLDKNNFFDEKDDDVIYVYYSIWR